ncbi:hypothetical protein [Rahnella sp. EDr1-10]|uniref:hypothetical protein n=1 Tax=Rahnella sp. EDr1-10 TaxID=3368623 RepID=UPI003BA8897A
MAKLCKKTFIATMRFKAQINERNDKSLFSGMFALIFHLSIIIIKFMPYPCPFSIPPRTLPLLYLFTPESSMRIILIRFIVHTHCQPLQPGVYQGLAKNGGR